MTPFRHTEADEAPHHLVCVAQLAERPVVSREAEGSSPVARPNPQPQT